MTVTARQHLTQHSAAPVRLREKIGYGLGDMGFNFYWANISAFLLIYYTDVFGISAAAAGTMMLVSATSLWGTIGGGHLEFMAIEHARKHYAAIGLGADHVQRFIR